jgi:hypothetical protein
MTTTICPSNPFGHDWQNSLSCRVCPATRAPGEAIASGLASRHGGDEASAQLLLDAYRTEVLAEELRTAAADLDRRVRAGGPRARGLAYARKILIARANGTPLPSPRENTDHVRVAATLRAQPGVWLPVGDYGSRQSAMGIAWQIRSTTGGIAAYSPRGAFESRVEPTPDGSRVFARYIGTTRKDCIR